MFTLILMIPAKDGTVCVFSDTFENQKDGFTTLENRAICAGVIDPYSRKSFKGAKRICQKGKF